MNKNIEALINRIADFCEEIVYPKDLEEAIIGIVEKCGEPVTILLDRKKCIEILRDNDRIDYDMAESFFTEYILGSHQGEYSPSFATLVKDLF